MYYQRIVFLMNHTFSIIVTHAKSKADYIAIKKNFPSSISMK